MVVGLALECTTAIAMEASPKVLSLLQGVGTEDARMLPVRKNAVDRDARPHDL